MTIYDYARIQMKKNGNPNQWGDSRPSAQTIKADINRHNSFLITEADEICGVFAFKIGNIRIDTHKDNTIMQHILESHHYIKCGTIYADDGTPRIAYQKVTG
jgi:hypothetical protein